MADVIVLNEIDSAKQELSTQIGVTTNTGGTSTAGTVMAKLNALLTWFTGTWTAARAGKIDTINNYTVTNNTASTTGILSQKVSAVIGKREASLTGVGATVYSSPTTSFYVYDALYCCAKFIAPISGLYTINVGIIANPSGNTIARTFKAYKAIDSVDIDTNFQKTFQLYKNATIGESLITTASDNRVADLHIRETTTNVATPLNISTTFTCECGEAVVLLLSGGGDNRVAAFLIGSVEVTYQPEY